MNRNRKHTLLGFCLCFAFWTGPSNVNAQAIKPLNGTWINLPYQDVRNKYMNPVHVDHGNPQYWRKKMAEYAEMGMKYIVIMAVANEEQSYYPSNFMKPAFPSSGESPVEAIMKSAEQHGLKVFMSCGWAKDQDDDIRKPEIKVIQQKIMQETAALYGKSPAFYGWYLPVEDSLTPFLPESSVLAINTLTEAAKKLTPNAKVMISPYGIVNADLTGNKFAAQIKKLKVDIIAYQDEVGCVREPLPMKRMKENFKILGDIHKKTNIAFWANVESFTWEKETNSRQSALIPASFPRYLSQIVGTSLSGAEEVISFSVYGIMDKMNSEMPIGQPIYAAKAYLDFMEWKSGKGRWPLLEKTFIGSASHAAIGKKVKLTTNQSAAKTTKQLTDNVFGVEDNEDQKWLVFTNGKMEAVVDLEKVQKINSIGTRFLQYKPKNVVMPKMVDFYGSINGKDFIKIKTIAMQDYPNDLHDSWIDLAFADQLQVEARYIKVVAHNDSLHNILADEIIINADVLKN